MTNRPEVSASADNDYCVNISAEIELLLLLLLPT